MMQPSKENVPMGRPAAGQQLFNLFLPFVFAWLYASVLTALPLEIFKDRANYLVYAEYSDQILARYAAKGLLSVLSNEPVWLLVNIGLNSFQSPQTVLRTIIFSSSFLVSFTLLRHNRNHIYWMIFFLLIPQVLKNNIIHLRQGLAISVFLAGYYAGPRPFRYLLMVAAGLIHSSFLIVLAIGVLVWSLSVLKFSPYFRLIVFSVGFVFLALSLSFLASELGARQGEKYTEEGLAISGLGFLYWLSILLIFISQGPSFLRDNAFPSGVLTFYVASYFLTPLAARIFESMLLFVLIAGLSLRGWRRQLYLSAIVFFAVLTYLMRIDQPGLGWGVE